MITASEVPTAVCRFPLPAQLQHGEGVEQRGHDDGAAADPEQPGDQPGEQARGDDGGQEQPQLGGIEPAQAKAGAGAQVTAASARPAPEPAPGGRPRPVRMRRQARAPGRPWKQAQHGLPGPAKSRPPQQGAAT
jgi:hypothetical protein